MRRYEPLSIYSNDRERLVESLFFVSFFFLSPTRILQEESPDNASGDSHAAEDGDAHETLLGNLVVDELTEVGGLQVGGLLVEQEVVVPPGLGVVCELVVAEGEVVEAFAAALGGEAEDVGEETDA